MYKIIVPNFNISISIQFLQIMLKYILKWKYSQGAFS